MQQIRTLIQASTDDMSASGGLYEQPGARLTTHKHLL